MTRKKYPDIARLLSSVVSSRRPNQGSAFIIQAVVSVTDECIEWSFYCNPNGRPVFGLADQKYIPARVALWVSSGPPKPLEMEAAHDPDICRNKKCINPRHLRWATRTDNERDKRIEGLSNAGERNHRAKLSRRDVIKIRASDESSSDLAKNFGVAARTIRDIKSRNTWAFA